jgi:hypothetical protein
VKEFVSDSRDAIGRKEKMRILILRLGITAYVLECIGLERVKMPIFLQRDFNAALLVVSLIGHIC